MFYCWKKEAISLRLEQSTGFNTFFFSKPRECHHKSKFHPALFVPKCLLDVYFKMVHIKPKQEHFKAMQVLLLQKQNQSLIFQNQPQPQPEQSWDRPQHTLSFNPNVHFVHKESENKKHQKYIIYISEVNKNYQKQLLYLGFQNESSAGIGILWTLCSLTGIYWVGRSPQDCSEAAASHRPLTGK